MTQMTDEFDRELAETRRLAAMEVSPEPVRNTAMEERIIRLQLALAARDAEVARLQQDIAWLRKDAERWRAIRHVKSMVTDRIKPRDWDESADALIRQRDTLAQPKEPT